jgi:hypothetical protein
MARLDYLQLGRLANDAGFRGNDILIAIGVAMAESGGDSDAVGDGGDSIGLWQINRPAWPTLGSVAELKVPANNARAAKHVHDNGRRGWGEWTTYRNGDYREHYNAAVAAVPKPTSGGGSFDWSSVPLVGGVLGGIEDAADTATDTLGTIAEAVADVGGWITQSHNWVRVGLVLGGVVLTIVAVAIVARPVVEDVADAVPAGKALRAVS